MPNQPKTQDVGDVADERGKVAPSELPGNELRIPEPFRDAIPPGARGRRAGAIEGLADPDADANSPDPSKPISMGVGGVGRTRVRGTR